MGLLRKGISILHFDETFLFQKGLQRQADEELDFRGMEHVNLYCEEHAKQILANRLAARKHKGITFIGNGNYHYVTYLLLKELTEPFTLVLFDNHPDLELAQEQAGNLLSCGSWVSNALRELPLLQRVIIIGPTVNLGQHTPNPRVAIFPFDDRHHYSIKSILSSIQTQNIYISIDKDVLNPDEVMTNWDQGVMELQTLSSYLDMFIAGKQVKGIDICGEAHFSPLDILLPDSQAIIRKNELANLTLLKASLKSTQQQIA